MKILALANEDLYRGIVRGEISIAEVLDEIVQVEAETAWLNAEAAELERKTTELNRSPVRDPTG